MIMIALWFWLFKLMHFRDCSFGLRVKFKFDSDFLIWLYLLLPLLSSHCALMKSVCQWQRAEFVIFLLVTSSLVLKLVFWFLQFLWRQFRQPKWCSFVWFRNCGGSHCCLLWRLFFTPQMHFWFINKRNYDDENENIYNNCDCNDDKVYEP